MNRKELTKTFMMISTGKKSFGFQGFHEKFSAPRVKPALVQHQLFAWLTALGHFRA